MISLKIEFKDKRYQYDRNDTERLKAMPMHVWFDCECETSVMRIPGFLLYRIKGSDLVQIAFKGNI